MLEQPKAITRIRKSDPNKYADCWNIYGKNFIISSSDNPSHPHGVWGMDEVNKGEWWKWNRNLGRKASWQELPETLQKFLVWFFSDSE